MPFVTVVVVTRNQVARLERCLCSLLAVDYPRFEILVVDSAPGDGSTRAALGQLDDPRVRYLPEAASGEARARNSGLTFARGEIVAFTSDEVLVDRSWLRELVAEFRSDPDVSFVTGLVLAAEIATPIDVDPRVRVERRVLSGTSPVDLARYLFGNALWGQGLTVNGAVRKDALDDGWRFDPNLGPGTPCRSGDDLDASLQLVLDGHQIVYQPAALVRRPGAGAPDDRDRVFSEYVGMSAVLFKHALAGNSRVTRGAASAVRAAAAERRRRDRRARGGPVGASRVAALLAGPLAYTQARLKNAWATA